LTRTAAFVGSPLYMSPEQMRSARDVDARADVWALGAILYAMVTGQLPHPGNSLPEVCVAVMNNTPRPLRDFLADAPDALQAILTKCLAKEPVHRYSSVAELAEQLLPFAPEWHLVVERATRLLGGAPAGSYPPSFARSSNTPVVSSVPPQRISAPQMNDPTSPSATEASWSKTGRKGGKRRRTPLIVAALLGLVGVLGALFLWKRPKAEAPVLAAAATPSSAVTTPLTPVVSDVHAAVPAASSAGSTPLAVEASNVTPTSSSAPSALRATARPGERVAPRAVEPAPGTPRYTYFGGRR